MNVLMRKGDRGCVTKLTTLTFTTLFYKLNTPVSSVFKGINTLFSIIYDSKLMEQGYLLNLESLDLKTLDAPYSNRLSEVGVTFNRKSSLTHLLFEELKRYTPLFNFYIRKVDKNVRKNSRGKSGKYMII